MNYSFFYFYLLGRFTLFFRHISKIILIYEKSIQHKWAHTQVYRQWIDTHSKGEKMLSSTNLWSQPIVPPVIQTKKYSYLR